jgi:hypothetical protein
MRWLVLPFVVVAAGAVFGISGAFQLSPGTHPTTPFDFLCYFINTFIVFRGLVWVFVQDGANFLATHHQFFNGFPTSPTGVKILCALFSLFSLSWWTVQIFHIGK